MLKKKVINWKINGATAPHAPSKYNLRCHIHSKWDILKKVYSFLKGSSGGGVSRLGLSLGYSFGEQHCITALRSR